MVSELSIGLPLIVIVLAWLLLPALTWLVLPDDILQPSSLASAPRTFSNSSLMSFSSFSVTSVSFSVILSTEMAKVGVGGLLTAGSVPSVPIARKPSKRSDIAADASS